MAHRQIQVSPHAEVRAGERGFTESVIRFVAKRGDVRKPAKNGRRAVFVSEHLADVLAARGFGMEFLRDVRRCCVIVHGQVVITAHDGNRMERNFMKGV